MSLGGDELWRNHVWRQLHDRDQNQLHRFRDVITSYSLLLEKTAITSTIIGCSSSPSSHLGRSEELQRSTGELAVQMVALQQNVQARHHVVEEQQARLNAVLQEKCGLEVDLLELQRRVSEVQKENRVLKLGYDGRLQEHRQLEQRYRLEEQRGRELLQNVIAHQEQRAGQPHLGNISSARAREVGLQTDLHMVARTCAKTNEPAASRERHSRLSRSASVTSPRILNSIKGLFKMRRTSVCVPQAEFYFPMDVCVVARVPATALHVLDAHEQGINAVAFSLRSDALATGGSDRLVKLWDVRAGRLRHRATLEGSTEGITSVTFDPTGMRVLAGSHDRSAVLWQLDDCVPKLTLTGHIRKVTAVRFKSLHQVATGSADRTLKLWDLIRASCVQTIEVMSYCSDLVCVDNCIVTGHYDNRLRLWDDRCARCVHEVKAEGRVTSLDVSRDQRHILTCCRDDCLQVVDLRMSDHGLCFRAEGFKCGSDSTKAVFSPEGGYCVVGSSDAAVYIWNTANGNLEGRLPDQHKGSINALSWSNSGHYVVSVDKSRRAVLWSDF